MRAPLWRPSTRAVMHTGGLLLLLLTSCDGTRGPLISLAQATNPEQTRANENGNQADAPAVDAGTSPPVVGPDAEAPAPAPDACAPQSCDDRAATCGSPPDGCSSTLDCGECPDESTCTADFQCMAISECDTAQVDTLLCEDFESGGSYTIEERDGSALTTTAEAFSGTHAFESTVNGADSWGRGRYTIPVLNDGSLFFRFHLNVPSTGLTDLIKIVAMEPRPIAPNVDVLLKSDNSIGAFFHNETTEVRSAPDALPRDTWVCLQGEFVIGETDGGVRLWLDNELAVESDFIFDTLPASGIETVFFGIHWSGFGETDATIYVDNLVFDVAPVDCL